MNEFITPFDQDYVMDYSEKINNNNAYELQQKYGLTHEQIDSYTTTVLATHDKNATIHDLEVYIKNQGYAPVGESIIEENQKEIQFSENVTLKPLSYCQKYWGTNQSNIVSPSKNINSTKNSPMATYIAVSMMSGKEGNDVHDYTGKGARIMNVKRMDKLKENLMGVREVADDTINKHIRKLLKLKTKEFQSVFLENSRGNQEQYYRLDYSDGFVTIDLRIIHYMLTVYSDRVIQAYIVFKWNCRNGWAQLTQPQMAEHLGLSGKSKDSAKTVMDKLVQDGFIEQRKRYATKTIVNKEGIPTSQKTKYYEYRVVDIHEIIEKQEEEQQQ